MLEGSCPSNGSLGVSVGKRGLVINKTCLFFRETRDAFMVAVPDRSEATLLPIIHEKIGFGTLIMSDRWAAYNNIANGNVVGPQAYDHLTVNHRYNFVDPTTQAHTQTIERTWRSAKKRNKKQSGTARQMIDTYLAEFLWRERTKHRNLNPFNEILRAIIEFEPPY